MFGKYRTARTFTGRSVAPFRSAQRADVRQWPQDPGGVGLSGAKLERPHQIILTLATRAPSQLLVAILRRFPK
jgi:hypothetical protein